MLLKSEIYECFCVPCRAEPFLCTLELAMALRASGMGSVGGVDAQLFLWGAGEDVCVGICLMDTVD